MSEDLPLGTRVMGVAPYAIATHTFAPDYCIWQVPE